MDPENLEPTTIVVSAEAFDELLAMLDAPPRDCPLLRATVANVRANSPFRQADV